MNSIFRIFVQLRLEYFTYEEMAENKNSRARIEANNRYNAKAYDRINVAVPKGRKDIIKAHAEKNGESVNGFVNRAINETMQRDGE